MGSKDIIRRLSGIRYMPVLIFIFSFIVYASNTGGLSIYILDEAKNAGCAREMYANGNLLVPVFNDVMRTDKPPLHYYFMMLGYSLFGVNAFAARFFSALAGAGTLLVLFLFIQRHDGRQTALWASLIMLASIHAGIQFHLAVPDPYLIFFMTCGLTSFYNAISERKSLYLLPAYVSLSLGVLAKGPVAIVLPLIIIIFFLVFSRRLQWKNIWALKPLMGVAAVIIIAMPWYMGVHIRTDGAWTEGFFMKHNFGRFMAPMEGHGGSFLITVFFIMAGLFPFSVFLPQAIRKAWIERHNEFILFNFLCASIITMFFLFSQTRLPNYTVPAYPFFALLLARYIIMICGVNGQTRKVAPQGRSVNEGKRCHTLNAGMIALIVTGVAIIPVIYVVLGAEPALAETRRAALFFTPLPLMIAISCYLWIKRKREAAMLSVAAGGVITVLMFFLFAFPMIDRQNPVYKSMELIEEREVVYHERFNPAFSFHLKKKIPHIEYEQFESFFEEHPDGVIISTAKDIGQTNMAQHAFIVYSYRDLFETPVTVLIMKAKE